MTSHGTPSDATTLMTQVGASGLDAPILDLNDVRWDRLRASRPPGLVLRDRFPDRASPGAPGAAEVCLVTVPDAQVSP